MKEKRIHSLLWVLLTLVLVAAAFFGARAERSTLGFFLGDTDIRIEVYRAENGEQYVFLPAGVTPDQLRAAPNGPGRFRLDGRELTWGVRCEGLETGVTYRLESGWGEPAELQFLQGENAGTVFLSTASGSLDQIHGDKEYSEDMWIHVWDSAGVSCIREGVGTLKGRGNATWKYEKKPYSVTLSEPADILGMGQASQWVLLANATDQSNLHNYLALSLAAGSGLEWTPECRFVNLYANGEYQGLYLLTEKVETGPQRLDIPIGDDGFLGKIDFASRWNSLRNPFKTDAGRTVEIASPDALSGSQSRQIREMVNRMEQGILSGSLEGMDLDSWVRRYLVDEITGNIDADLASSYFYGKDGVVFAGPVWDYDRAFGNTPRNENPESFIAANREKARGIQSVYYGALTENPVFRARVAELYRTEFLPRLEAWTTGEILEIGKSIAGSAHMNDIRWAAMFAHLQEVDPSARNLTDYIRRRMEFLNSAWLDGVEYCTLQLELTPGSFYRNFAVKKGEVPDPGQIVQFLKDMDPETAVWTEGSSGQEVPLLEPMTENRILRLVQPSGERQTAAVIAPEEGDDGLRCSLLPLLLILGLGILIFREFRNRKI